MIECTYISKTVITYSSFEQVHNPERVLKINCRNNKLKSLPDSIVNFTILTHFDCSSNNLTHLPDTLGQLTKLTIFECHNNNLTYLPDSIGDLVNLLFITFLQRIAV